MRLILGAIVFAASLAALPALADENVPLTPDEAALACQARVTHEMEEQGRDAEALEPLEPKPLENHRYRVKGAYAARIDGERRVLRVVCDVSSEGVDVFSMDSEQPE